jgi:hypothetical protein
MALESSDMQSRKPVVVTIILTALDVAYRPNGMLKAKSAGCGENDPSYSLFKSFEWKIRDMAPLVPKHSFIFIVR